MLKLPISAMLTVPTLLTLPTFVCQNFLYGIANIEVCYLVLIIQIVLQSIPRLKIFSFLGWVLLYTDSWLGFCWIFSHLIARSLCSRDPKPNHPIVLALGLVIPFLIQTLNLEEQCIAFGMILFLLSLDNVKQYPFLGIACFLIPWLPLFLGYPAYKMGPIYPQIQQMFKPELSLNKPLNPAYFRHLATVSHEPLKLSSGVPNSILLPLAYPALQSKGKSQIQFSHHFRTLQPTLAKHFPLYFLFREGSNDLFLGYRSLLDFLLLAENTKFHLEKNSKTPPAAVIFSQVFSSYDVISFRWPENFTPKLDLAIQKQRTNVPLPIAHKTFEKGIWYQLSKDPKLKPLLTSPKFYKQGALWMLENQQAQIADQLIFQLERLPDNKADVLILKTQSAITQGQFQHALNYAQQAHESYKDPRIKSMFYRLLQKSENDFIHYGQDFDYQILLDLSRQLYDSSKRTQQDLLFDSLRYQRKLMPQQIYDPAGCMDCAKKRLLDLHLQSELKNSH